MALHPFLFDHPLEDGLKVSAFLVARLGRPQIIKGPQPAHDDRKLCIVLRVWCTSTLNFFDFMKSC